MLYYTQYNTDFDVGSVLLYGTMTIEILNSLILCCINIILNIGMVYCYRNVRTRVGKFE